MLKQPRLKYGYRAEFLAGDNVLLMAEKDSALVSGKLYRLVLSEICREGIPAAELVARLAGRVSAFEVYYALEDLEKRGFITEAVPGLPPEVCSYWHSLGIEPQALHKILQDKTVQIETAGGPGLEVFLGAFAAIGIQTSQTGEAAALKVIITDDYRRSRLRQLNLEAIATKRAWMLIKPVGVELWLGPLFLPGQTGCWECLQQRLEINQPQYAFYQAQENSRDDLYVPAGSLPSTLQTAANLAALEIARWLYDGKNDRLAGTILTFSAETMTTRSHRLVKRPQCKTCGEPGYNPEPVPIILKRNPSQPETALGGYREVTEEETLETYRHHVSPITGVVPVLKPYHRTKGAPVCNYSSGRNTALRSKTLFWLNQHLRSGNGGKGRTWSQAQTGALSEALERYSFSYHGEEFYITSNLRELGHRGIHPNACMNYSETQYRDRETFNQTTSKFYNLVPIPFDESLNMHWTPVYSLSRQTFQYLPSGFCYAQYPAADESRLFFYPDSNGSAAGNSLAEAILHGFLELVERDSVALWWYNRLPKPAVDLHSFNDPYFARLLEYYKSLNRCLYVLELTADLQIPVFAALSYRPDDKRQDIVFGFGAHVDARLAVERALIELNQILPIVSVEDSGRGRRQYLTQDKTFLHWLESATVENQPYLVPVGNSLKKAADYSRLCEPTIYDSLSFCLETAAKHGLETLVLDMTRPDIGLKVAKVIIPGLRHFWKRLAPGRLYDIPVKMGWLKEPLREDEMNPKELFI
jgi:bacteriocin biosynthesis cyclodehydratase domain-containing protein